MADQEIGSLTMNLEPDEQGQHWLSIEDRPELGRKGPFQTQEEAASAASAFIETVVAALTAILIGD